MNKKVSQLIEQFSFEYKTDFLLKLKLVEQLSLSIDGAQPHLPYQTLCRFYQVDDLPAEQCYIYSQPFTQMIFKMLKTLFEPVDYGQYETLVAARSLEHNLEMAVAKLMRGTDCELFRELIPYLLWSWNFNSLFDFTAIAKPRDDQKAWESSVAFLIYSKASSFIHKQRKKTLDLDQLQSFVKIQLGKYGIQMFDRGLEYCPLFSYVPEGRTETDLFPGARRFGAPRILVSQKWQQYNFETLHSFAWAENIAAAVANRWLASSQNNL